MPTVSEKATKILDALVERSDRYTTAVPRGPCAPPKPLEHITKWQTLLTDFHNPHRLSELVDEVLRHSSIDPQKIPVEIREEFDRIFVEAAVERDDTPYLRLERETLTPNFRYEEEHAAYLTALAAYEVDCEEYLKKLTAYVEERNAKRLAVSEEQDRKEYERLRLKFGGK